MMVIDRFIILLMGFWLALDVVDIYLTRHGIKIGIAKEKNKLWRWFMKNDITAVLAWFIGLAILFVIYLLSHIHPAISIAICISMLMTIKRKLIICRKNYFFNLNGYNKYFLGGK